MITNNPLHQYFRRPAVYIRLPSNGKYYDSEIVDIPESGELPIYPMTAIDDITLKTPDALFNGSAVADVIKSCIPNIKDPWKLNNIDLDAILLAIRAASGEGNLEIESECPACQTSETYSVALAGILSDIKAGDYDTPLHIDQLKIKFKPLTYKEVNEASKKQFEAQKLFMELEKIENAEEKENKAKIILTEVTVLTIKLIALGIDNIQTPQTSVYDKEFIIEFLHNCDKNVYEKIKDSLADLRKNTEIKPFKLKCVSCSHEYEQQFTVNASDFFA